MLASTLSRGVHSWSPIVALFSVMNRILAFLEPGRSAASGREMVELPGGPRDCVLVLDASPSMEDTDWEPSRLAAALAAAWAFCQRLASVLPDARIALVAYGEVAVKLCPLIPAARLQKLADGLGRIRIISCTNITSGAQAAFNLLKAGRRPGQVVLLSDGHHNTGPDPRPVAEALKRLAIVETVGIGGSPSAVDEPLLKEIASSYPSGKKRYRWIGDKNDLIQHFDNLAGGISRS